jgi:hypothetical protein
VLLQHDLSERNLSVLKSLQEIVVRINCVLTSRWVRTLGSAEINRNLSFKLSKNGLVEDFGQVRQIVVFEKPLSRAIYVPHFCRFNMTFDHWVSKGRIKRNLLNTCWKRLCDNKAFGTILEDVNFLVDTRSGLKVGPKLLFNAKLVPVYEC